MKTIEERAFEIYPKEHPDPAATFDLMLRCGYVRGATEQQEIDIQRACKWLKDRLPNGLGLLTFKQVADELCKTMKGE